LLERSKNPSGRGSRTIKETEAKMMLIIEMIFPVFFNLNFGLLDDFLIV